MKIGRIHCFVSVITILFLSSQLLFGQSSQYLGQAPPGTSPLRLVPDSMAANNNWQYHGTPSFSPDGNEMYYAIYRFATNKVEIWYTEYVNGKWSTPKKAPFSNDNYVNNNPTFSGNKDTLYFLSTKPGGVIYRVNRSNGVWSTPTALNLPIPSGYQTGLQFSIADNGNIYLELNQPGSETDIYCFKRINGIYQSPELIVEISSPQLDFTPYIDPQERFLMFASRRSGGYGNTSIYLSKKTNGSWGLPICLPAIINSGEVIQPSFSRDGKYFFYEAWVGNLGGNPYWVSSSILENLLFDTLTVTDYDGNIYKTIKIGNQIWMAENLRTTHYSNGAPVSYLNYNNDTANAVKYGRLYTSSAVMNGESGSNTNPSNVKGISPEGWHIPSKSEWEQLSTFLGGTLFAGGKLKETGNSHWLVNNVGATNESGFTALPSGMFDYTHVFQWLGEYAAFSSSNVIPAQWMVTGVRLQGTDRKMIIGDFNINDALSVRCVKNQTGSNLYENGSLPLEYNLSRNYPNPFNPATTFEYDISNASHVTISIFNVLGEVVYKFDEGIKNAGSYKFTFNAKNLTSGIYFYQLTAGNFTAVNKMLLLK